MGTQVSTMALNRSVYSAASHGQIVANIESNSQMGQSRDWTNVYVEDMAFHSDDGGFRCVEDGGGGGAAASSKASNLNMFKQQQPPQHHQYYHQHHHQQQHHGQQQQQPQTVGTPSTAIFLENQDILSDTRPEMCSRRLFEEHQMRHQMEQQQQSSKFNRQRHSLWVDNNGPMMMNNNSNQSDFRRYSDTRLIMEPHDSDYEQHRIFNVATAAALVPPQGYQGSQSGSGGGSSSSRTLDCPVMSAAAAAEENNPQITDILFESTEHGSSFDPLELNIQELLELDIRTNLRPGLEVGDEEFRSSQLSVNSDPQRYFKGDTAAGQSTRAEVATQAEQKHLLTPQSLPNLSASSEELNQQKFQ